MVVTLELLKAFPLLKPLSDEVLAQLATHCALEKHSRRGVVLSAGKREGAVCFLFEGRLQGVDFTLDGREVGIYFVEKGDICGELALFDEEPQSEFVIAVTQSVVLRIPAMELRKVLQSSTSVMSLLGKKLAAKIRRMTAQRSLLALPNVGQRVCHQLWILVSDGKPETLSQGHCLEILNPPTHKELAIMLNLSRETVTRVFQILQNRQIVKRDGASKLVVHDLKSLKGFADGSLDLG